MITRRDLIRVLTQARNYIADPSQWTQGASSRDGIRRCLVRAVGVASREIAPDQNAAMEICDDVIVELRKSAEVPNLAAWNDDPKRTHADVLRLLDVTRARAS